MIELLFLNIADLPLSDGLLLLDGHSLGHAEAVESIHEFSITALLFLSKLFLQVNSLCVVLSELLEFLLLLYLLLFLNVLIVI